MEEVGGSSSWWLLLRGTNSKFPLFSHRRHRRTGTRPEYQALPLAPATMSNQAERALIAKNKGNTLFKAGKLEQ